jgi:hypothetical protein
MSRKMRQKPESQTRTQIGCRKEVRKRERDEGVRDRFSDRKEWQQ